MTFIEKHTDHCLCSFHKYEAVVWKTVCSGYPGMTSYSYVACEPAPNKKQLLPHPSSLFIICPSHTTRALCKLHMLHLSCEKNQNVGSKGLVLSVIWEMQSHSPKPGGKTGALSSSSVLSHFLRLESRASTCSHSTLLVELKCLAGSKNSHGF